MIASLFSRFAWLSFILLLAIPPGLQAEKKERTAEDICSSRQVEVYDGCRKAGGSESHCWQYSRQKYKDCMRDQESKKKTPSRSEVGSGANDRPGIKPATPKVPRKPVDSGAVGQNNLAPEDVAPGNAAAKSSSKRERRRSKER